MIFFSVMVLMENYKKRSLQLHQLKIITTVIKRFFIIKKFFLIFLLRIHYEHYIFGCHILVRISYVISRFCDVNYDNVILSFFLLKCETTFRRECWSKAIFRISQKVTL